MEEYKLSLNAWPQELTGGKPIAPGETVKLTAEDLKDPHNKSLVDDGWLMPIKEKGGGK